MGYLKDLPPVRPAIIDKFKASIIDLSEEGTKMSVGVKDFMKKNGKKKLRWYNRPIFSSLNIVIGIGLWVLFWYLKRHLELGWH